MSSINSFEAFLVGVNPWWDDSSYRFDVTERDYTSSFYNSNSSRLIQILIGARRVGKTSILRSIINKQLATYNPKQIIYIPADLAEVKTRGLNDVITSIFKRLKLDMFKEESWVFIDEIQEVNLWQKDIKLLYDNTKINFYLTGSSSLLLKKETSKLTGRFLLTTILPLSFSEYLRFTKASERDKSQSLDDYLMFGGYPEYVINKNPVYLQQAVESTLYRELLDSFGIRNPGILNRLLSFLADKVTSPVSASRIAKDLKIDDKTAKFYLEYLQAVYLVYPVYRFGLSHRISKSSIPKFYFNDVGILQICGIRPRNGHLVENAVFLHLLRSNSKAELPQIYYDVVESREIDFVSQGKYFEVKEDKKELLSLLSDYESIGKEIAVIINASRTKLNSLPHYSNLSYRSLLDFLQTNP